MLAQFTLVFRHHHNLPADTCGWIATNLPIQMGWRALQPTRCGRYICALH